MYQKKSLIDICAEKRFWNTLLWIVRKGVPVCDQQLYQMIDQAVALLNDETIYICEKKDSLSLLVMILESIKKNVFSLNKSELDQVRSKISLEMIRTGHAERNFKNENLCSCFISKNMWNNFLILLKNKQENQWKTFQWYQLDWFRHDIQVSHQLFLEKDNNSKRYIVDLIKNQYSLANRVIEILSLNFVPNLMTSVGQAEVIIEQKMLPKIQEQQDQINSKLLKKLSPYEKYGEIFRIISSGFCSQEEIKRCEDLLSDLTTEEINNTELWRGIPLILRMSALICDGRCACDLFKKILIKPGIDITPLIQKEGESILVSQKYVHNTGLANDLIKYFNDPHYFENQTHEFSKYYE